MDFPGGLQLAALLLFLGLAVYKTVTLRVRLSVNSLLPDRRSMWALLVLLVTSVWAFEVMLYALPGQRRLLPPPFTTLVVDGLWADFIGSLLIVGGSFLNVAAHRSLGDAWRLGIDERTPGDLVTGGVYAITRNPIYVFLFGLFLGTWLLNGTLVFLLYMLVVTPLLHRLTLEEERFLSRRYGERFARYRRQVPRYLAFRVFARPCRTAMRWLPCRGSTCLRPGDTDR